MIPHPLFALFALAAAPISSAQERGWTRIELDPDALDLSSAEEARFEKRGGRPVLCLEGKAFVPGLRLAQGSIAVDIANEDRRHFANILFRASGPDDYESVYLRMHKSRQADAMQYSPTFNRETNWQMFWQAQASADLGTADWVTLRVDFAGTRARASLHDADGKEASFVTELAHPENNVGVGLQALFEGCFANLRYSREVPDLTEPMPQPNGGPPPGAIVRWSLSSAFPMQGWAGLDELLAPDRDWESVASEANGTLLISRYRAKEIGGRFSENGLDGVFAGIALHSDAARKVDFSVDASDMATVYLNGGAVHAFDNSFRAKGGLYRGEVGPATQVLRLPLKRGRNELVVLVADRANGWGLAGAIAPADGVRIAPLGADDTGPE